LKYVPLGSLVVAIACITAVAPSSTVLRGVMPPDRTIVVSM
jgi:hypothetical protein